MRAIVFVEKGKVELQSHFEAPPMGPGEVRMKTLYTGVTVGTERNGLLQGPYSGPFPTIPGYQTIGEVIDVGSEVTGFEVGDICYSDGGSAPVDFKGFCWGGHLEIRNRAPGGNLVKIPKGFDLESASLLGVMGVGMKAAKKAKLTVNSRVLVIGMGLIGQGCLQASLAMGAEVHGLDPMAERRAIAEQVGINKTWDANDPDVFKKLAETGSFDAIFETTGISDMPDKAIQLLTQATGVMVAIGGKFEMKYDNLGSGQTKEATITHTSHFGPEELIPLIRLIEKGRINVQPIITHRLPVEEAPGIYDKMVKDPSGLLGVVFKW